MVLCNPLVNETVRFCLEEANDFPVTSVDELHTSDIQVCFAGEHLEQQSTQVPIWKISALLLNQCHPFPKETA